MTKSSSRSKSKSKVVSRHSRGGGMRNTTAFSSYMNKLKDALELKGGAYSVNPEQSIAGQPVIVSYPDKYSPAILNHTLATNPPGSACGVGGGRRVSRRISRSNQKRRGGAKTQRKAKSKKSSKHSRRHKRRHTQAARKKQLRGGSMPAPYDTAFNNASSVMTDDMMKRDFTCSQPSWKPECI